MRIVFLALALPNLKSINSLYVSLVAELHKNGHDVLVVAPTREQSHTALVMESGVKVLRVHTQKLFGVGMIQKGFANVMLPYQYINALKKIDIDYKFDVVITPTPPITLFKVVLWLKKKNSKAKIYLILRDIFPQNAVDLGLMRQHGIIHAYFRKKEKDLYAISDHIGCMSNGNIEYVKKHNPTLDSDKLHLLPNWANISPILTKSEIEDLKKKEALEDKFIVMFGGNIGLPQKMENIVELAIACQDHSDILFIIMGKGNAFDNLRKLAKEKKVTNIQMRNGQEHEEYFQLLQMADVGLISLSDKFTIPNTPSKSLSYYNAKKPILASIDLNTDFGTDLEKINAGLWAEAGKTHKLKEKLMQLYHNGPLRKQMGENGYRYMENQLSSQKAYETIMRELNL